MNFALTVAYEEIENFMRYSDYIQFTAISVVKIVAEITQMRDSIKPDIRS